MEPSPLMLDLKQMPGAQIKQPEVQPQDLPTGLILNMNLNNNNNAVNQPKSSNLFLTKKEIEVKQKFEMAKRKLKSIFEDDDENEDDIFSKNTTTKAEKSLNFQDRFKKLFAPSQPTTLNKNIFQQPPKKEVKKKISFFDDEDSIDLKESSTQKTIQIENNLIKASSTLFDGIDISKTSNVNNIPQKETNKKALNFLFDDDDSNPLPQKSVQPEIKIQPQIQQEQPQFQNPLKHNPQPQVQEQPQNALQIKPKPNQENSNKKPSSLLDNIDSKKTEKKETTLFDTFETDKNENDIKLNISRNKDTVANVASNIGGEIKKEQEKKAKKEEKPIDPVKRLSLVEQSKKANVNKMASKFEEMLNKERLSVKQKAPPKKLDFAAKISGLQNLFGNRVQKGGNVFIMPVGGIKSGSANIVHDSGNVEEVKTVEKEISPATNNALIEETKIQETSYEQQLEKKKKSTVVVKKKKPRKIKFDSGITEVKNNQIKEKPKPVTTKINLFDDLKPKEQEKTLKINLLCENNFIKTFNNQLISKTSIINKLKNNNENNKIINITLEEENEKYKIKINQLEKYIKELELKLKERDKIINEEKIKNDYLNKQIKELKDISNINSKINNIKELENEIKLFKSYYNFCEGEKLISIKFVSVNQDINFDIIAKNTEKFTNIESKLYEKYPKYIDLENFFLAHGNKISKHRSLKENKINNNDIITFVNNFV